MRRSISGTTRHRAGSASNHSSVMRAPRWNGIVAVKSGTKRLIFVLSKTALWLLSPSSDPRQCSSKSARNSEGMWTRRGSTPAACAIVV